MKYSISLADKNINGSDRYRQMNETDSYAGFGQVDWLLTENVKLTVGGRYNYEKKEIVNNAVAGDFVVINQTFANTKEEVWTSFIPKNFPHLATTGNRDPIRDDFKGL